MNINMPNLILRYGKVAEEFDVFGYMWINIVCQNKIGCYMVVGGALWIFIRLFRWILVKLYENKNFNETVLTCATCESNIAAISSFSL